MPSLLGRKGNAPLPGYRAHKVVLGFALAVGAILGKEFSEVLLPVNGQFLPRMVS